MKRLSNWIIVIGILLILCALGLLVVLNISTQKAKEETEYTVSQIKELLPPESAGEACAYSSAEMPSLEINGKDVIGLLRIDVTDTELPIGGKWDKSSLISFPQRFSGSVYDGTLIVGGYDRKGQLDCLKKLDIGDEISVTDMTGARYTYNVEQIDRSKSAKADDLEDERFGLTLFVQDEGTPEYIIVRCSQ